MHISFLSSLLIEAYFLFLGIIKNPINQKTPVTQNCSCTEVKLQRNILYILDMYGQQKQAAIIMQKF